MYKILKLKLVETNKKMEALEAKDSKHFETKNWQKLLYKKTCLIDLISDLQEVTEGIEYVAIKDCHFADKGILLSNLAKQLVQASKTCFEIHYGKTEK